MFADLGLFMDRLRADYRRFGRYFYDQAGPEAVEFDHLTMTEWFEADLPGGAGSLLGRALEAAWMRDDGRLGLRFSGLAGEVVADRVVFALPFTVLCDLDLSRLPLSARKRRAIDELAMGTNAKLNVQLRRSFAALDWTGSFSSDEPHYVTWDSTYGQTRPAPATPVRTVYNGGREGASYPTDVAHAPASPVVVADVLANLERGVPGVTGAWNGLAFLDWGFPSDRSTSPASTPRPSARGI